ncbi:MAG: glycosyltransferase [Candidatus Zixiibacteriota bacterium]|nr:MAG: glycosyltransferase [candidate division Zixibacteria bacterium]
MNKRTLPQESTVTVCVTSYNHERFIRTCIDSLLGQTYPHLDIHVIDDCSTDKTADILRSYGSRINLTVREKNLGVEHHGETINEMIRAATGEFFYRIDSDDFVEPDYIERMIREFQDDPNLDWVCGGLNVVDERGDVTDTWEYTSWPTEPEAALQRGFHTCSVIVPHNGLFRISFLRENGLFFEHFPYGWGEDVLFTLKAVQCSPGIKLIEGPGFNWRTHGSNNSCDVGRRIDLVVAVKEYYAENVADHIYLKHPLLAQYSPGSAEYQATKQFLLALNLYEAKKRFRVPQMFENVETHSEIDANLYRFDNGIRRFAEQSLRHSRMHEKEIEKLYGRLAAESEVLEGRHRLTLGDFDRASQHFHSVLQKVPDSVDALCGMTEVKVGLGDVDGAGKYAVQAVQLAPQDPRTLNNAGVILYAKDDFENAEETFLKTLAVDPGCGDAHLNLLQLYADVALQKPASAGQRVNLMRSAGWIAGNGADESRIPLLIENRRLRETTMDKFTGRYTGTDQRILLHRPANGALRYLMESWSETLDIMGVPTMLLDWGEDTAARLSAFKPTAIISVADPAYQQQLDSGALKRAREESGLKIGYVTTLEHSYEPVDFYVTFHRDPARDNRYSVLDQPLLSLPFAINPQRHYMQPGREVWDFFFVGTNSHLKNDLTEAYLTPVCRRYRGILAGVGWPVGIGELPLAESSMMYNFARIYPNYHLRAQHDAYNEVNDRTFIIPACGGFELVDNPMAMSGLFTPDEMAVATSPSEYAEMFEYFLHRPEERVGYIQRGMRRVWEDYTLCHVLGDLVDFLGRT